MVRQELQGRFQTVSQRQQRSSPSTARFNRQSTRRKTRISQYLNNPNYTVTNIGNKTIITANPIEYEKKRITTNRSLS